MRSSDQSPTLGERVEVARPEPRLFNGTPGYDAIRIWIPSGPEALSLERLAEPSRSQLWIGPFLVVPFEQGVTLFGAPASALHGDNLDPTSPREIPRFIEWLQSRTSSYLASANVWSLEVTCNIKTSTSPNEYMRFLDECSNRRIERVLSTRYAHNPRLPYGSKDRSLLRMYDRSSLDHETENCLRLEKVFCRDVKQQLRIKKNRRLNLQDLANYETYSCAVSNWSKSYLRVIGPIESMPLSKRGKRDLADELMIHSGSHLRNHANAILQNIRDDRRRNQITDYTLQRAKSYLRYIEGEERLQLKSELIRGINRAVEYSKLSVF